MTGNIKATPVERLQLLAEKIFGGLEEVQKGKATEITKIAVVGAMTAPLILEAASNGVQLYITGQMRKPAIQTVQETGMHVLAVGHRRSEQWGLLALAALLQHQWNALDIVMAVPE
jgi:putative NIF3 family GTP cyclohydrolase 1 type 2